MSTVQEIEAAIQALPATEWENLVADLPGILPELNGDATWERILSDPRPRPACCRRRLAVGLGFPLIFMPSINPIQ